MPLTRIFIDGFRHRDFIQVDCHGHAAGPGNLHQPVGQTVGSIHERTTPAGQFHKMPGTTETRLGPKMHLQELLGMTAGTQERQGNQGSAQGSGPGLALGKAIQETEGGAAAAETACHHHNFTDGSSAAPHDTGFVHVTHGCDIDHELFTGSEIAAHDAGPVTSGAVTKTEVKPA